LEWKKAPIFDFLCERCQSSSFLMAFLNNWQQNSGTAKFFEQILIRSRVARFFSVQDTKTGNNVPNEHKVYQIVIKNPKCSENIPNGHKIFQQFPI
jgi:hypothetical protein